MKKLFILTTLFIFYFSNSFSDLPYFIDFTKVLNSSKAGSEAQKKLAKKFETQNKNFAQIEKDLIKEEGEIISQKKLINNDEYKKKVEILRDKVVKVQKDRQDSLKSIAKSRTVAKQKLLKAVNPIMKKYMEDNKIRIVIDKKSILLGDTNLEITDQIISILDKELPSLK